MDEAERCNRVGLMFQGEIIQQGEPERLRSLAPGELLVLYTPELQRAEELLPQFDDYIDHQVYGDRLHIFVQDARAAKPRLQAFLTEHDIPIQSLFRDEPRLEEAFIYLIRQATRA
jgi:ABC-2 type transport system ATP-binding protein